MAIIPRRYRKEFNYALVITALIAISIITGLFPFTIGYTQGFTALSISDFGEYYRVQAIVSQFNPDILEVKKTDAGKDIPDFQIDFTLESQKCNFPVDTNAYQPIHKWDAYEHVISLCALNPLCNPSDTDALNWCRSSEGLNEIRIENPSVNIDPSTIVGAVHHPSGALDYYYWCVYGEKIGQVYKVDEQSLPLFSSGKIQVLNDNKVSNEWDINSNSATIQTDFGRARITQTTDAYCYKSKDLAVYYTQDNNFKLTRDSLYSNYLTQTTQSAIKPNLKSATLSGLELYIGSLNSLSDAITSGTNFNLPASTSFSSGEAMLSYSSTSVIGKPNLLIDVNAAWVGVSTCYGLPSITGNKVQSGEFGGWQEWQFTITNEGPGCGVFDVSVKCEGDKSLQAYSAGTKRLINVGDSETITINYKATGEVSEQDISCVATATGGDGGKSTFDFINHVEGYKNCVPKCDGKNVLGCSPAGEPILEDTCTGDEICDLSTGYPRCTTPADIGSSGGTCSSKYSGFGGVMEELFGGCGAIEFILFFVVILIAVFVLIIFFKIVGWVNS